MFLALTHRTWHSQVKAEFRTVTQRDKLLLVTIGRQKMLCRKQEAEQKPELLQTPSKVLAIGHYKDTSDGFSIGNIDSYAPTGVKGVRGL